MSDAKTNQTSKYRKPYPLIIAILSAFACIFYNELNISLLRSEAPERLEPKYDWVKTADDISYLRPAENYYLHGVWKDNNAGKQSYFLRTPGYGFFRYVLMEVFGMEESYTWFRYVQVFIFSVSVWLLFYCALLSGLPRRYAFIIEIIYGLSPFASGFLYYSITEAITPAFMIAYVFCLLKGYRESKYLYFILASILLAFEGLTRPVLLPFGLALPLAIYWSDLRFSTIKKLAFILLTGFIALEPIGMWAIRSNKIAGENVGLYPIYYAENNSQYRPTHRVIWEFEKSYGTEGHDFHTHMVPLWQATMAGDTSDVYIDSILMACPSFVKHTIGESRLRNSYTLYRKSILYQKQNYPDGKIMPDTIPAIEQAVIKDFGQYTDEVNSKHWIWCHVVVPVRLFKSLSFHSNLSLYMFQHTYRGRWWMEGMRVAFLLLHMACCLSFIFIFLWSNDRLVKVLLGLCLAFYFFYLCYVFRGLEERYTLPVLPLMLLALGLSIYRALQGRKASLTT